MKLVLFKNDNELNNIFKDYCLFLLDNDFDSRKSYVDSLGRMQVIILTTDGKTHVLNFQRYNDPAHSHIVYQYGEKVYPGTWENRDCFEHGYSGYMVDYYDATHVYNSDDFPFDFEQKFDFTLDSLSTEQLQELRQYLLTIGKHESNSRQESNSCLILLLFLRVILKVGVDTYDLLLWYE